jgi:hypothetical protein
MEIIQKSKNIYIAKDGKKFTSQKKCEEHENEIAKMELKEKILNVMTLDELNDELTKIYGEPKESYSRNIFDALKLEKKLGLLNHSINNYVLYQKNGKWHIGHLHWEEIESDVVGNSIQEVICRTSLLHFYVTCAC